MSWRTVVISSRCKLDTKMGYMVVRGEKVHRVFLDEIAMVIIENPAVAMTGCLLSELMERKIKVILCDSRHTPQGELVREFDRDKLFVIVGLRSFFSDGRVGAFLKTASDHGYRVLLLDCIAREKLPGERRLTIDIDLCEF